MIVIIIYLGGGGGGGGIRALIGRDRRFILMKHFIGIIVVGKKQSMST